MLPRNAALLSSLFVSTMASGEIPSRVRLAIDGKAAVAAVAGIAAKLPPALSGFVHCAASAVAPAISLSLHVAFVPADVAVSLLMACYGIATTTVAALVGVAPLLLQHWM